MLTRHKIPTVFSIYMMDVLCCALGCIVLLWQVSYQDAEQSALAAYGLTGERDTLQQKTQERDRTILALTGERDLLKKKTQERDEAILALSAELASLKDSLQASFKKNAEITVERDKTKLERDQALQMVLVSKQKYDQLQQKYLATETLLATAKLDVKNLQTKSKLTAEELADRVKANLELLAKIAKAEAQVVLLTKDVDAKKLELLLALAKVDDQSAKLKNADSKMLNLDKLLAEVRGEGKDALNRLKIADLRIKLLEQEGDRGKSEIVDSKRKLQLLMTEQDALSRRLLVSAKDLTDARAMIASLEGEKISLANKARNIQAAAENRFAGITLTGKKVVFIVDMSGSMELIDENTLDPDKWPLVCETVGRLMRSLTDLRNFQVILFSDQVLYPLRNPGRWHDYVGPETAKDTVAGLKAVKPKGGTDMYAAFAEAFRFRSQGLDTIYFLSDGLPNLGDGTPSNASKLTEQQLGEILGKHIRQKLKTDWNRYTPGQPRVRINSIGFFFESPDVGAFLWALSREHDGSFVGMSK